MTTQSNTTDSRGIDQQGIAESIGVRIENLPETEKNKLVQIFELSGNRKRRYHHAKTSQQQESAKILISSDCSAPTSSSIAVVTFGMQFSEHIYHLKPPLMSLRVLRTLYSIPLNRVNEISPIPKTAENKQANQPVQAKISDKEENSLLKNLFKDSRFRKPGARVTEKSRLNFPKRSSERTPMLSKTFEKIEESSEPNNQFIYKVLIIDDSVLIHKALSIELDKAPHSFEKDFVESGEQGLEKVKVNHYDMIFLDIMMPGIDGYETCTQIRQISKCKKIPIIMLSAKSSPLDEVKGIMAGCTTYLTKPIKHDDFQKMLNRMGDWLDNFKIA